MNLIQRSVTSTKFQKLVNQKKLSAGFGRLSNSNMPKFILKKVIKKYVKAYKIDLSEYEIDVNRPTTFNSFFIRKLKDGQRTFEGLISSAAEGYVAAYGAIKQNQLFQIKGKEYDLEEILAKKENFPNGSFITIYLSPADYHRVHAPFDCTITQIEAIPGKLYSVNRKTIEKIDKIYCKNERVILKGSSEFGNFYLVLVGAIVVGKIKLAITDKPLKFNMVHDVNIEVKRGQEMGHFELGSTILLIMDNDMLANLPFEEHQRIILGEKIC
jgi:phosphatidylserine decarboxylase